MIGTLNIQVGGDSNSLDVFDEEVADIVISTAGFAQIAAANGYVKLEPGQCVVDIELLKHAIRDIREECIRSESYCRNECGGENCHVKELRAALEVK